MLLTSLFVYFLLCPFRFKCFPIIQLFSRPVNCFCGNLQKIVANLRQMRYTDSEGCADRAPKTEAVMKIWQLNSPNHIQRAESPDLVRKDDKVKVHYTGTLLDGTKFDSSLDRGEPAQFGVGQVIKGWTEGLQIMPVGSKYIFWIPSDLAYGERGAGRDIKPNSVLKFEVELLEIVKDDAKK